MDDPISRQAAIDAAKDWYDGLICGSFRGLEKRLKSLSPAQPERKKGQWEITNLGAVGAFDSCSECKKLVKHKAPFYNYCPNCGADMKSTERWEE